MINKIIKNKGLPAGRQGFTLIETLVAVLILATAIAGPLTIASRALNTALIAKDQITAFYLAQDAVEYIRYKRDTNRLSSLSWLTGINGNGGVGIEGGCENAKGCYLDSTSNPVTGSINISFCNSLQSFPTSCSVIKYDSTLKRYSYVTGTNTIFRRAIKLTQISSTEEQIQVLVLWTDQAGFPRQVTVRENIYDWE